MREVAVHIDHNLCSVRSKDVDGAVRAYRYDGSIRDQAGLDFLFRLRKFKLVADFNLNVLMIARQDDFVRDIQRLQRIGLAI